MSRNIVDDKHTADGALPVGKNYHFCVLEFVSVHIPGDERSRTNPGHGYPATNESYTKFHVFTSQESLEEWISERRDNNYIVLHAKRLGVKTTHSFEFE